MSDNHELDIQLAKLRGWTIEKYWNPTYRVYYYWLKRPGEVTSGHGFGYSEEERAWQSVPHYTSSLDPHFRDIWPEIERRGLQEEYLTWLHENTEACWPLCRNNYSNRWEIDPISMFEWFLLITPEQHTRAAIAVLGGKDEQ